MKRREFITLLGGAVAWPLPASAQQSPKLPTIGFLSPTTASVENQRVAAFVQRLRAVGWIEGRTVAIKVRWAEGRSERAAEIVAEFVRQKVDVIVSRGTVSVLAAKQATSVIPIVFAGGDPVGTGFVVSLARPGGNVTGLSFQQTDLAGKRLELLREVVPALRRLAILANAGNSVTLRDIREVEAAAGTLGLTVVTVEIRRIEDIAPGFQAREDRADMLALGLASAHAARPCLRGDRIAMHFAAVHEPCIGTSRRITFSMAMAAFGAERTCMGV